VTAQVIPVTAGGNWNRLKTVQNVPEQHNGKARNQGTTENSHTWALHTHCGKY